jgi:hypothetical protein
MKSVIFWICAAMALSAGAFDIANVQEEIPEAGMFTRTQVTEGKTVFSFIAPNDWAPSVEAANKRLSLHSAKLDGTITLRLLTNSYPATAAKFKEQLLGAYTDATVTDEFGTACGSGAGLGLEIRHTIAEKFQINSRVAVFPAPEGTLEVSLSTSTAPLASFHPYWVGFINSLRVERRGEVAPKQ